MLPFKLIYHDHYDLQLGDHVFPSVKYRLVRERLLQSGLAADADFVAPEMSPLEDLVLAHTEDWVVRFKSGRLRHDEVLRLEIPYTQEIVTAFHYATGGTTLTARLAIETGAALNIGGGFHHAFSGHGEGFCALNDIAVAVRVMQRDRKIRRAAVVDCDVHHGNGTASIFRGDPTVYTCSLHHYNNYPEEKPPSDLDVHFPDGVKDVEYLSKLQEALNAALESGPDLLLYVAGADPYEEDQLGGLGLTIEGLRARDRLVFAEAKRRGIPVAVTLAGGYARQVNDTVAIHCNTAKELATVLQA